MLQHGQLSEKKDLHKKVKTPSHKASDYLTDEEDGYTEEVREKIDEELLCLPAEKSLNLEDLISESKKSHIAPKNGKKRRVA